MRRLIIIFAAILSSCASYPQMPDDLGADSSGELKQNAADVEIVVLDVGQADSILVRSAGESMLVDAGDQEAGASIVMPYLDAMEDVLMHILITHYHADHAGGLEAVVEGKDKALGTADDMWPIEGFLDRGDEYADLDGAYKEYQVLAKERRQTVHAGDEFGVGDAVIKVVAANEPVEGGQYDPANPFDENSASIVLLVTLENFKCLLAADVTGGGGDPPYDTIDVENSFAESVGHVQCLKVAHHGSKTSTNQNFVDAITPEVSIISVGDANDYGHPNSEVVERLVASGSRVIMTAKGFYEGTLPVEISNDHVVILGSKDGTWKAVY